MSMRLEINLFTCICYCVKQLRQYMCLSFLALRGSNYSTEYNSSTDYDQFIVLFYLKTWLMITIWNIVPFIVLWSTLQICWQLQKIKRELFNDWGLCKIIPRTMKTYYDEWSLGPPCVCLPAVTVKLGDYNIGVKLDYLFRLLWPPARWMAKLAVSFRWIVTQVK